MKSLAANRAVLLTPQGPGAIAVVRVMGPAVAGFLGAHFSKPARSGRCVHGVFRDDPREIDDPVVVLLPDEGAADINLHGGPWIVQSVLDLAREFGFEVIDSSQPPLPAESLDGQSDIERDMLSHLPLARTELGVRALLGQPAAWEAFDRQARARSPDQTRQLVTQIISDGALWHLLHPPRVAIVGAANVGKSTLANRLFAQERSITADVAGTTRDWVGEITHVNGLPVMLVDTPGIRLTEDLIEQAAIKQSRRQVAQADLVILVLDASRPLEPEQSPLMREFAHGLLVVNKSDRLPAWDAPQGQPIATVATTGGGVETLRQRIAAYFDCDGINLTEMRWWTEQQRENLRQRFL